MTSLKFPKMFSTSQTEVWRESEYNKATTQNVKLLLASMRGELLGDPFFGLVLKQYLFEQNNYVLRDMLIDMIYTQVAIFIPQLYVKRSDIKVFQAGRLGHVYCHISGINQIDYVPNTYEILLFNNESV